MKKASFFIFFVFAFFSSFGKSNFNNTNQITHNSIELKQDFVSWYFFDVSANAGLESLNLEVNNTNVMAFDCSAAIPIACKERKREEDFSEAQSNNDSYPCATGDGHDHPAAEKIYTFTLDQPRSVRIFIEPGETVSFNGSYTTYLLSDCSFDNACESYTLTHLSDLDVTHELPAGTYYIVIESTNLIRYDIFVDWDCASGPGSGGESNFNICDVGGAFINNGININGKITNRDFPLLDVQQDECILDNYSEGVSSDLFFDTYLFYYDPAEGNDELGAFVNDENDFHPGDLKITVYRCGCEDSSGANPFACDSECLAKGGNVNIRGNRLEEGFYFFIVSGVEGQEYELQIIPEGLCDRNVLTPITCGEVFEGNFEEVDSEFSNFEKIDYSCYDGDQNYTGYGVILSYELFEDSKVNISLSANEPMGLFLYGPNCGEGCLDVRETEEGQANFEQLELKQGLYYLVVDKTSGGTSGNFTLSLSCERNFDSPIYFQDDNCPKISTTPHKVNFLNLASSTIKNQEVLSDSRISFFHTINDEGWLALTAENFYRGNPVLFELPEDSPDDSERCSYKIGDPFLMKIQFPSDDIDYDAAITIKGTYLSTDQEIYKKDGASLISEISEVTDATLTYLNINVNSICIPPEANTFRVELSSNIGWRIESASNSDWVSPSLESGVGLARIDLDFSENTGANRTETLSFIGNDGSLRTLNIIQKSRCPLFNASINNPNVLDCNNPTVQLNASTSEAPGTFSLNWQVSQGGNIIQGNNTLNPTVNQAGTYTLTIDNGQCTIQKEVIVQAIPAPQVNIQSTNIKCNGDGNGTATINISEGTSPYQINWPDGNSSSTRSNLAAGNYNVTITDNSACQLTRNISITEPQALSLDIAATGLTGVNANDGTINTTVTGGTAPYTYAWSNGASAKSINNLAPGNYAVTITDSNGCSTEKSSSISNFECAGFSTSLSKEPASCSDAADGKASVSVSGQSTGLSYQWSGRPEETGSSIENLSPGEYSVVVTDAQGCAQTIPFEISFADNVQPTLLFNNPIVQLDENGVATLTPIEVDNGSTDNCGIDKITLSKENFDCNDLGLVPVVFSVIDVNGNNATTSISVTVKDEISPQINCPEDILSSICTVDYILPTIADNCTTESLQQDGGLPSGSVFEEGVNELSFSVSDPSGNSNTCAFRITIESDLAIEEGDITPPSSGLNDGTINVNISGGIPPYAFSWTDELNNTISTEEDLKDIGQGSYTLTVIDASGCQEVSNTFMIEPLSFLEPEWGKNILLFPNPTSNYINIRFEKSFHESAQVSIFDLLGQRIIYQEKNTSNLMQMDLSDFSDGLYLVKIGVGEDFITRKFILSKKY